LRSPKASTCQRAADRDTSSASSFPKSDDGFCARSSGSPPEPPSPIVVYSRPSGPNARWPPLWLLYGSGIESSSLRLEGSARLAFER
jgi:hypothetical protein